MPQSTAVWCLIDDGVLETSILMSRQKYKYLARHRKPGLFVLDAANPSRSVERRAEVDPTPDPHKALLRKVAAHYVVPVEAFGASGDDPVSNL